jgi:hypothetical protein
MKSVTLVKCCGLISNNVFEMFGGGQDAGSIKFTASTDIVTDAGGITYL